MAKDNIEKKENKQTNVTEQRRVKPIERNLKINQKKTTSHSKVTSLQQRVKLIGMKA